MDVPSFRLTSLTFPNYKFIAKGAWLCCLLLALGSCSTNSFKLVDIAKSDTSLVIDIHRQATRALLKELTIKLYKRNPRELAKNDRLLDERLAQLFAHGGTLQFPELGEGIETVLMERALSPEFNGDRVFCLMAGLIGMMNHSYNYLDDFYLLHKLDEQKLYKSARNIERLAWRLNNKPLLLTNSLQPNKLNLSFERMYGKLIAHQDAMALIAADSNKRVRNFMVQGVASVLFMPL